MTNIFNRIIAAVRAILVSRNATDIVDLSASTTGGIQMGAGGRIGCKAAAPPGRPDSTMITFDQGNNRLSLYSGVTAVMHTNWGGAAGVWVSGLYSLTDGGVDIGYSEGASRFRNIWLTGNGLLSGWLLVKGVRLDICHDFNFDDWQVIGAAAGYQMQCSIVAQVALLDNVRGGIVRIWSVDAAAPNWLEVSGQIHTWSAQDAYRIYSRFTDQQIVNISSWVGVSDGPSGVDPYGAVAGNGVGLVQDDAVGANWLLRQVRGGVVVDDSTGTAAVAGAFHTWDLILTAAGVPTAYYDGTLVATGAAADSPTPTTMLEPVMWVAPLGAAILAQLDVDCFKIVQSRNTAVTP